MTDENRLNEGDTVVAIKMIYDLPNTRIAAKAGDIGVVKPIKPGRIPTVWFKSTGFTYGVDQADVVRVNSGSFTSRITVPAAEELLGSYFPVHNHGFIGLKDYMSGDDGIEEAARGSYKYGTRQKGDQRQLLRSLMRRRHTSPFEQVELKVHCAMPIFVARQWVRHRTASLNEMSGRYSLMPMLFYKPLDEQIKKQSKWDKQGRDEPLEKQRIKEWNAKLEQSREGVQEDYRWATEEDIARELARIDLPLSTYTQWVWKIDLHNLFHALGLRCDLHAQWETRVYFNWLAGLGKRLAPVAFEAWEDYHFYAKKFSRMEMEGLRRVVVATKSGLGHMMDVNGAFTDVPNKELRELGMSKTELTELMGKFAEPSIINFDINMGTAQSPEFFEEKFRKAAEG